MAKINTVTIARAFDHKTFGRVGIAEMTAEVGTVKIEGKELPATSVEYLLTFALQNLQDAYAGANSEADAKARFGKKLDRLIEGTIGVRAQGDGANARTLAVRAVVAEILRGAGKWKEIIGSLEEADRGAKLDEIFAKQPDAKRVAIETKAEERMVEAAARKAQAKELASGLDL